MNWNTIVLTPDVALPAPARVADYVALCKLRISSLVLFTVAAGAWVASWGQPEPWTLLHTVLATGLVAASASVANQWRERQWDRRMARTADRPLAAGRITAREGAIFATLLLSAGFADLWWMVSPVTALWALLTWVLYVLVYTPLKRVTRWNTLVGAIPGALPILIGWSATGQPWDVRAVALFLLIFLWQFPHFMAIAWKYRHQYAAAGFQMLPVVDPTGRRAGEQAVAGAVALLPVTLVPALVSPPSAIYVLSVLMLGLWQVAMAVRFLQDRNDRTAKSLLRATLIYLPLVLLSAAMLPLIS